MNIENDHCGSSLVDVMEAVLDDAVFVVPSTPMRTCHRAARLLSAVLLLSNIVERLLALGTRRPELDGAAVERERAARLNLADRVELHRR